MALISMRSVSLRFGGLPLLDEVDLQIERGDRICLIGGNGAGKSSLLKLLHGSLLPDSGEIVRHASIRVSYLPQEVSPLLGGTCLDVVCPLDESDADGLRRLEAERLLARQGLSPAADFALLSGGNKRRALLARALLDEPDIVLLDEPTNHLDIDAIQWLEGHLAKHCPTIVFVTHDREFLRRMARRIVELDRGRIIDWACDYDTFLRRKDDVLQEEARLWEKFDTKLRSEEAWLRQGVKARTTRNQGRLRKLLELRRTREARRVSAGSAQISIQEGNRSGDIVFRAEGVSFEYEAAKPLIRDLSTVVFRGDRVGVLGPNGCGKTTLIRLLLGDGLRARAGEIRRGASLQPVYSDQLRDSLKDDASLYDSVADGRDYVMVDGARRHTMGYLGDFLFPPERVHQPVGALSGGERNRLLLARLFAEPSNLLILDEPTNDLDLGTLELLEEQIANYSGTVLVVSHDRAFLNNIATEMLVFERFMPGNPGRWLGEGDGWSVNEYAGGYDDWLLRRPESPKPEPPVAERRPRRPAKAAERAGISYNEQRELAALPAEIEKLENAQAALHGELEQAAGQGAQGVERMRELADELADLGGSLEKLYERWTELESRRG